VLGFIDKWNDLDHSLATMLLKLAESKADLERVRNLSQQIAGADENSIKNLLGNVLKDVDFFRTPEGKWLESVAAGGILQIINSSHEIDLLKQVAAKTKDILDGGAIENVLDRLHKYIDDHLHLTQIENAINQADFDNLDKWLIARLSAFLGQTVDFSKLDEIRQAINTVRSKGQEFYKVGLKALTNKYKAEFIATYQKTTTNTALIDVIFDFAVAGVGSSLEEAVDGKFDGLLIEQRAGVQLNTATLSHEIKRHSHVELSLPFFKTEMDHINTSLAQVTATDDDGRVLVYELDAKDIAMAKNRRNSTLAVGGYWPIKANNQVRVHSTDSLNYSYSLRQVKTDMKRADLQYQLRPYAEDYFSTVFSAGNSGNSSGSFDTWLSDLDNVAEQVLHNGPDNFGDTLLSLQVGVGSRATASWVNAPEDEKSPRYLEMSRRIQAKLKQSVPLIYFQDPHKYEARATAAALLTYSAIPPSTEISLSNGQATLNASGDVYWEYQSPQQVEVMLSHPQTINSLSAILQRVSDRLLVTPGFQGLAAEYKPERLGVILGLVRNTAIAQANLHSLLFVESKAVNAARDAGRRLAKFIKAASDRPSDAVEALTEFGAKFTETFNSELSGLHGGFNSRPLGTLLFIEAALALNPGLSADDLKTNAVLELIVLTENAKFQPAAYLNGEIPPKEETVIEQRIVNLP
jgi:hypothetical protein